MTFEEWLNENEGFSLRMERAYDELVKNPIDTVDNWPTIKKWLKAAYDVGKADCTNEHKKSKMTFEEFITKVEDTFMSNQPPKVSAANRWRYGQTLMNILHDVWPEKYKEFIGSKYDCFYTNQYVNLTIDKLEKEWNEKIS